jgi:propionyl-CoA carboxylase alpha chain
MENVQFLGPSASAIHKLGDKLESKRLAAASGVSIVPGHDAPVASLQEALSLCGPDNKIPYPVLIKAASGGGGKGMRVCQNVDDLTNAWDIATAEALKFFGDDRLLIERYIATSHHIEFQVLADRYGNVAVFPERECSIQRRNQKIIEESPSTLLSDDTRRQMARQVRALCRAAQYESAGTVEFLVDHADPTQFYFLEMNTRLQVEHPVTEAITGTDLVEAMLKVGAGETVPYCHADDHDIVPYCGHGIECRVYAEDPTRQFLPSTGPLTLYHEPPTSLVRIDGGVTHGQNITSYFDPMLAKVIAYGQDRNEAIHKMEKALDQYVIDGVRHNLRLIRSVLREPDFIAGHTPTSFLPVHYPPGKDGTGGGFTKVVLTDQETHELAVAAALILRQRESDCWNNNDDVIPPRDNNNNKEMMIVRLGGQFGEAFGITFLGDNSTTTVQRMDKTTEPVALSSVDFSPRGGEDGSSSSSAAALVGVILNGVERHVQVFPSGAKTGALELQMLGHDTVAVGQSAREYELTNRYLKPPVPHDMSHTVPSPMPGLLVRYAVSAGDVVVPGQELCVVESMKMQNMIRSPRAGIVAACHAKVGDSLRVDQVLITFRQDDDGGAGGAAVAAAH